MDFSKREYILISVIAILVVLLVVSFFWRFDHQVEEPDTFEWFVENQEETERVEVQPETIFVDIKGGIVHPGVYELEEGKRVKDIVEIAGGFLADANKSAINLAARLEDEMVIYVPLVGEEGEMSSFTILSSIEDESGKININRASQQELEQLPGIGPAKAAAIITYRDEIGTFKEVEDLLGVPGIGEKSLENLKEHIQIK